MATDIAIVDCGGANIASLQYALKRLNASSSLTLDAATIRSAKHVILPGVGAAADAMQKLRDSGLAEVVPTLTQPVLGICLGMQLLAAGSDEDQAACLGIVAETAHRLPGSPERPVPHMGWSQVSTAQKHALLDGIPDSAYFYFVHSYALPAARYTTATTTYGETFSAVLQKENFHAVQFHPERSAATGSRLLQNFLAL